MQVTGTGSQTRLSSIRGLSEEELFPLRVTGTHCVITNWMFCDEGPQIL